MTAFLQTLPEGRRQRETWYGGIYRYHAISSVQYNNDWQACARWLGRALIADPSLAQDASLYYELALGSQPLGYRGTKHSLNLRKNAGSLVEALESLFDKEQSISHLKRDVLAAVHQAIGMAAYSVGDFRSSRRYLCQAVLRQPSSLRDRGMASIFIRSFIGRKKYRKQAVPSEAV
jgi:hypothetical protein